MTIQYQEICALLSARLYLIISVKFFVSIKLDSESFIRIEAMCTHSITGIDKAIAQVFILEEMYIFIASTIIPSHH